MQMHPNLSLTLTLTLSAHFLMFLSPPFLSCVTAARAPPQDLLRSSCTHARYPNLCVQTLSSYAGPAKTPLDLAQAAVKVSLGHARSLSGYLNTLQLQAPSSGSSKRQQVAVSDYAKQMSDSVDELSKTLNKLQHLLMGTFEWHMSVSDRVRAVSERSETRKLRKWGQTPYGHMSGCVVGAPVSETSLTPVRQAFCRVRASLMACLHPLLIRL